jgi:hypothetical protein
LLRAFEPRAAQAAMDQNIVPKPIDGRIAVSWFRDNDIRPDLVHLDASHDFEENLELMSA